MNLKKAMPLAALVLLAVATISSCKKSLESGAAGAAKKTTMILLTERAGIDDKSFNASAWEGITRFYGESPRNAKSRDILYKYINADSQDMIAPNIKMASDEGADLIAMCGFTFADGLKSAAPRYPLQKYLIVDDATVTVGAVRRAVFSEHQGSYLVGAAAALKARADNIVDPKFGFIGGVPGSLITKFEMGYVQGVRSVLPNAQIVDFYANDWGKPELAKTQAKTWYDSGVYAIYMAAGATGNGAIAQAKEYRLQGKNIWAIGVDSDQYEDGVYADGQSAILTSMIKRVDVAIGDALKSVADQTFTPGMVTYDLAKNGLDFSTKNSALTSDIIDRLNTIKANIIDGTLPVYSGYAEARSNNAAPAGLNAKDD